MPQTAARKGRWAADERRTTMAKPPEQITELNRATVETAMKLAQISVHNAEHLVRLQLDTIKDMLEENLKHAKALTDAKDPQHFAALRAKAMEESVGQVMRYSRSVYDLAATTQAEFGKIMEQRLAAFSREVTHLVDDAAQAAPAGSEPAIAAFRQTLAATHAMVETMTKTAKQLADAAHSNIQSATAAGAHATKSGAKKR
jgi:phasin family protein